MAKLKAEIGRTYQTRPFNHLIKIISIGDGEDQLTKINNISESSNEWLTLKRVEEKITKLIR